MNTPVLTVTQLNRNIRSWLEKEMGVVQVEGEISNLSKPSSGHFYFTLKDASAQIRCVFFHQRWGRTNSESLENGQKVIAKGQLSLYEARGDYQLIIEEVSSAGQGDLFKQFEELKKKLAGLGLFDGERKKALPRFPHTLGIISSSNGAALRDILITLSKRYPIAKVVVYPSEVQGKSAPSQLIEALALANREMRCQVLLLARGGGSIEDLWAFNDERLAYAITESAIPIISGVGHETDFTIADFVADFRAATPTAAAQAATPCAEELLRFFSTLAQKLQTTMQQLLHYKKLLLTHQLQKIASPKRAVLSHWQHLDFLNKQLQQSIRNILQTKTQRMLIASTCLNAKNPQKMVQHKVQQLSDYYGRLVKRMVHILTLAKQSYHARLATLHAVSPLATLDRGYSIVMSNNHVITDATSVKKNAPLTIKLAKGELSAKVI